MTMADKGNNNDVTKAIQQSKETKETKVTTTMKIADEGKNEDVNKRLTTIDGD